MSTVINTLTTTRTTNRLKLTDKNTFDKAAYQAYETLKAERDALKEAEAVYKRRIEGLEKESADLLSTYEDIYSENNDLRNKLDPDTEDVKVKQLQEEVARVETKTSNLKTTNTMLQGDVLSLQKQVNTITAEKEKSDTVFAAERQLLLDRTTELQKENDEMKCKINIQNTENSRYIQQVSNADERQMELDAKYKQVKRLNIKSENSNKQQKHLLEQEITEANSIKIEQQKEIANLKATILKLQTDVKELISKNSTGNNQVKQLNIELEIYKQQTSKLKTDVKEKRNRYHELEEELQTLEVKLDDTRYEGFEAVLNERTSLLRREKSLIKRTEMLEHQVEEHLNSKKELEKQNEEYRMELETATLERDNSVFAEAAMNRKMQAMESKYGLGRAIRRPVRRSGTRVLVTMGGDQVERLENENQLLLNKLKLIEATNRKLELYARELENKVDNKWNRSHYSARKDTSEGHTPVLVEMKKINNNNQHPHGTQRRAMHPFPSVM